MKLTDKDIKSILKILTPNELLKRYIDGTVRLTSKQIQDLIDKRDGKKEVKSER